MLSKTLTLRITDKSTLDAIEFIKINGGHKTDSKAIISSVDTFEADLNEFCNLKDHVKFLEYKIAKYEAYFEMIVDAEAFKKEMVKMPKITSLRGFK